MTDTLESAVAQHRRRYDAAMRCEPLACGCRDPLTCRCYDVVEELTEQFVDGYRDAAEHLLAEGFTPAPNIAAMRMLWRRGGGDQRLARRLSELWEVAA